MFKIINDFTACHLKDTLNQYINSNTRNLRNTNQYRNVLAKTECFKLSFFPNTIKDWNLLNHEIKSSATIGIFKSRLKKELFGKKYECNYYYYLGRRKVNSILSSMRMGCSSLNFDLYRNQLVNSATCQCGTSEETVFHFFLECNLYLVQRNNLFEELSDLRNLTLNINTLLHGSTSANKQMNEKLHESVSNFIISSKRFF